MNTSFEVKEISPAKELSNITGGVYPINLFSKCIFKDIEVELESQKISLNASNTYPVRSCITTILSYGQDAANGHLDCSYWAKDLAGAQDRFNDNAKGKLRAAFIEGSKMVYTSNNIHTELTSTSSYIMPGVNIKLRFIIENLSLIHI